MGARKALVAASAVLVLVAGALVTRGFTADSLSFAYASMGASTLAAVLLLFSQARGRR